MSIPTEIPDLFGEPIRVGDYITVPIKDMLYIAEVIGFTPKMVKLKMITMPWRHLTEDDNIKLREIIKGRFIKVSAEQVTMYVLGQ